MKKPVIILSLLLTLSIAVNGYQYFQSIQWVDAFFKQAGVTSVIETVLKSTIEDTSYENILKVSNNVFVGSVSEIKADDFYIQFGVDTKAIKIHEAIILFKNNKYYGTKVYVPDH